MNTNDTTTAVLHHASLTDSQRLAIAQAIERGTTITSAKLIDGNVFIWVHAAAGGGAYRIDRRGRCWPTS